MAFLDIFKKKPTAPAESSVDAFSREPLTVGPHRPPRDLPISSAIAWDTVTAVNGALTQLELGIFNQSALLLDAMMGDSHIAAKLDDRLGGLFGAPMAMKAPVGMEENEQAMEICAEAEEMWPGLVADSAERAVTRDGIMLGAGLGEIIVTPRDGDWSVMLKHWHARHLQWRWNPSSDTGYSGGYWITTMRGQEELRPDDRGGFYSKWTDAEGVIQISRWWLYTPYGYQRGWVNGRIKAIATAWLLRRWAFRDWGRHSEILGIPPKKVTVPVDWDDEDKQRALREVASLSSEGAIMCPQKPDGTGFDVELLELKGPNAKDTFDGLIEKAEASITVALVGQTLTTQNNQRGGSRALGEVHERVEDKIRRADAGSVSRGVRSCILMPWSEWNFGGAELAPVPTWDVEPAANLKAQGDGLKALGDGMRSLIDLGVPLDRAKIVADAAIPVEAGKEFEEPTQPPAPPNPFGGGGAGGEGDDEPDAKDDDPEALSRVTLSKRTRAPLHGQVYADQLADAARTEAARLLSGDVRAIKKLLSDLKPTSAGGVDVDALRTKLLKAYGEMDHSKLARLTEKVLILAALSGRYAVQKEI